MSSLITDPEKRRIRSVLVVDDDVELAMMYRELLGSEGFEVVTASNGVDALKYIMTETPDAISTSTSLLSSLTLVTLPTIPPWVIT